MNLTIKKWSRSLTGLFAIVSLITACKKDGTQYTLTNGSFTANALSANTNSITLQATTLGDTAVVFHWPAVGYGIPVVVSYTVQLDIVSDTSGSPGWTKAVSFTSDTAQLGILGTDLNNYAAAAGYTPGVSAPVAVRVISNVVQQNGAATTVPSSYSNTIVLNLTPPPFPALLYVPGAYQGWNPSAAPVLNEVAGRPGLYEGYVNITGSGGQGFKYTDAPDWNHTNYGDNGMGTNTFSTNGQAGGLFTAGPGYFELTANLVNNTWSATPTTWSIIGDATPGGWTNDTQLSYDATDSVWKVTANMLKNGSWKFRANDAWNIDFGVDGSGNLAYADNSFFGYNGSINNITVPADGNYTIILDLHVSGSYSYKLIKN